MDGAGAQRVRRARARGFWTSSAVTGVRASVVALSGPDADDAVDRLDEDLAVAHRAGARGGEDRVDGRLDERLGAGHLDLHLLVELEHDVGPAPDGHGVALAAVAADAGDRDAGDPGAEQRLLDGREALGADDAADQLHSLEDSWDE